MNRRFAFVTVAAALLLFAAFVLTFQGTASAANPGPLEIPTPVSVTHSGVRADTATFFETVVLTDDTNSNLQNIADHAAMDVQWVFDQTAIAAAPNTTTLTIQFSNDGVNWVNGAALVSNNSADATDMNQFAIFGRYARVNANLTNNNPVTITVIGVSK